MKAIGLLLLAVIVGLVLWGLSSSGGDKYCVQKEQDKIMQEDYQRRGQQAYSSANTQSAYYQAQGVCGSKR